VFVSFAHIQAMEGLVDGAIRDGNLQQLAALLKKDHRQYNHAKSFAAASLKNLEKSLVWYNNEAERRKCALGLFLMASGLGKGAFDVAQFTQTEGSPAILAINLFVDTELIVFGSLLVKSALDNRDARFCYMQAKNIGVALEEMSIVRGEQRPRRDNSRLVRRATSAAAGLGLRDSGSFGGSSHASLATSDSDAARSLGSYAKTPSYVGLPGLASDDYSNDDTDDDFGSDSASS